MSLYEVSNKKSKSNLYSKYIYTTNDFDFLINEKIIEYDIREAGWNLTKYYRLLSKSKIKELSCLSKDRRKIEIGKLMRSDIEYNKELTESFSKMRKKFFIANELMDNNILSIKNDAIFVFKKICDNKKFDNVEFVEKNVYSSYHKFGKIEMYFNSSKNILDIKGISENKIHLHKSFINILKRIFLLVESNNKDDLIKFIKRFSDDYKNKRLVYNYYRELNPESCFRIKNANMGAYQILLSGFDESFENSLDISYNYLNYILPIIQRYYW